MIYFSHLSVPKVISLVSWKGSGQQNVQGSGCPDENSAPKDDRPGNQVEMFSNIELSRAEAIH